MLPNAEATKALVRPFRGTDSAYFDLEKRVVSFGRLIADG